MLRHILGDSVFIHALYAYANNPVLKYSTATTHDFQSACEIVSGKDLNYFFQEWIYGGGYPIYDYSWDWKSYGDSSAVMLTIEQTNAQNQNTFFSMPIDVQITSILGDTIFTVWNNVQDQNVVLYCKEKPASVVIDPYEWVLKSAYLNSNRFPSTSILEQNYPNPFNRITIIPYKLRRQSHVTLNIYDILGRKISTLVDIKQSVGMHEVQWIPAAQASGIYFYQLAAEGELLQKKMIFIK